MSNKVGFAGITAISLAVILFYLLSKSDERITPGQLSASVTSARPQSAPDAPPATAAWEIGAPLSPFTTLDRGNWPQTTSYTAAGVQAQLEANLLAERALVLLHNQDLPLAGGATYWYATLPGQSFPDFARMASRFAHLQPLQWAGDGQPANQPDATSTPCILAVASDPQTSLHQLPWWSAAVELSRSRPVIVVHFGLATGLTPAEPGLTLLHQPHLDENGQVAAAQALFGATPVNGRLNYRINNHFATGAGLALPQTRLQYGAPEVVGIDRNQLLRVDGVIETAIRRRAMPGAQLLVAKSGKIIYEKAYGKHTYQGAEPVLTTDLYDLASLTKAVGTTLAVMKLYEQNRLNLADRLSDHLDQYGRSAISYLRIQHLLAHHSGLQANLPVAELMARPAPLSPTATAGYGPQLGKYAFLADSLREEFLASVGTADITRRPTFKYSDLNFLLLQQVVEKVSQQPLDEFLQSQFYTPLGLHSLGYRPTFRHPLSAIVPTADDRHWRGQLVHGIPHDEGATLLGGVGGHAGLFSHAADVAAVLQMLLNGGSYGGQQLLQPATIQAFTAANGYNYRGFGFDRLAGGYRELLTYGASEQTFGHTGFTGVCAWADPENELVFVLLTNRIHPDPANERFIDLKVRLRVQREVYRALGTYTSPLPLS